MELWNNTTTLAKAALVTPYVFILLGALVAASGIYLKGVIEKRVATIVDKENKEQKNTPPAMKALIGTAISDGKPIPGRTLLQITAENDIEYNASWHVTTRKGTLVSGWMTAKVRMVPTATPVFKTPILINADRIVDEYIELTFLYESIHSPELGNPRHLRGQITLPYRYSEGRVLFPTPAMVEYWRNKHPRQEPAP